MKVTTEELERCEVLLTIEVEPAKEQDLLRKAARQIAREIQIPGFRPGKAPYNTVVRRFGLEAVQQEALEASGEKLIREALTEADLSPTAQLSFDNISWNPLTITVKVPLPPKVELGDYRDMRLDFEPVEVTAEEVEAELQTLQEQNATWAPVDRPAQLHDLIAMSVVEKDGDEILAEHESVEYELILPAEEDEAEEKPEPGSQEPDLTTPLLGLSAGEEKTFNVTYDPDYDDERYAGKEITFTVQVSSVKEKELDPLDDEFAQSISEYETLTALKEKIEANLREQRELERDQKLGEALLDGIIEEADQIEWPLAMEEEMIDDKLETIAAQFRQSGLTLESYLQIENKTEEDLREDMRDSVINELKRVLVLGELLMAEKLSVSNTEILERAKLMADVFGGGSEQVWRNILASETHQNRIANDLLVNKVFMRLAAIAKGEAPDLDEEDEDATAGQTGAEAGDEEEQAPAASAGQTTAGPEVEKAHSPVAGAGETAAEAEENVEEQASDESEDRSADEASEDPIASKA